MLAMLRGCLNWPLDDGDAAMSSDEGAAQTLQ
jgi:hypothetical protein